jgi:hypothetical protein
VPHPALPGGEARLRDRGSVSVRKDLARDHQRITETTLKKNALAAFGNGGGSFDERGRIGPPPVDTK